MKSFMRNQRISPQPAIRADARFDALVKKEMQEHQHLIASHNKEMQSLREECRHALEKSESLAERSQKELAELKDRAEGHILILKEMVGAHALTIAEQKKAINSLHEQLNDFRESHASQVTLEKFKRDMESKMSDATMSNIVAFQDCQRECKRVFDSLKDETLKAFASLRQNVFDAIAKGEENFSHALLDKEGIERELIRYKKDVFYIEKKIENIYTLIERINKRGEACHKPE